VYEGNVPGEGGENTWCPACSSILIERYGYLIKKNRIQNGACPDCGISIAGIGM
jgi:pyruvate formate lyase activating enzyme